jgi:hypothetical protein
VPGAARVYRVVPGRGAEVYCDGFSFIVDLDFDRSGNLYVLQFAAGSGLSGPGVLLRVGQDCSRTELASDLIALPPSRSGLTDTRTSRTEAHSRTSAR